MNEKEYCCVQCDMPFLVSVEKLERLQELGFDEPTRCPECRKRKSRSLYPDPYRKKKRKLKNLDDELDTPLRHKKKFKRGYNDFRDFME
jgi:DNA-directed RNA polymerase subunit RPC12/RpoP